MVSVLDSPDHGKIFFFSLSNPAWDPEVDWGPVINGRGQVIGITESDFMSPAKTLSGRENVLFRSSRVNCGSLPGGLIGWNRKGHTERAWRYHWQKITRGLFPCLSRRW